MNCNKCGTPILPGENTCRFCGTINDFSARVPEQPKLEIIDFDIEENVIKREPKIINFMLAEDEVSIDPEPAKEVIDFDDSNESEVIKDEQEIIDDESEIPTVNPIMDEPATAVMPVKEVKKIIETEEIESNDSKSSLDDLSKKVDTEIEKKAESKLEDNVEKKPEKVGKDDRTEKSGKSSSVLIIVLIMLLILSIILNCFLLMGKAKKLDVSDDSVSGVLLDTVYSNYEFRIPNNWNVNNSDMEKLLIYDKSKTWGSSISISSNLDFNLTKENASKITEEFGKNNYLFTSDYTKTINDKELYIFKGKYYSYATYIIITKVDDNVIVADLKFTGEVKEDILTSIFNTLTTTSKSDINTLLNNDFEFNDVTKILSSVLNKKKEK